MTRPLQTIDGVKLLQRRITAALAAVRGARDTEMHCPSIENRTNVEIAERHLDALLADQRLERKDQA